METPIRHKRIDPRLSSACCALLGIPGTLLAIDNDPTRHDSEPWLMNIALANYIEHERNTGIELIVDGQRAIDEDSINVRAEIDVITGATPNGATASNVPQTFTMSSGIGSYSVAAGELPADDTHMDTRLGLNLLYSDVASDSLTLDYRSYLSMEFDYFSLGAGFALKKDINQHNTALLFAYDVEYNRVHPVGNIPIPFASMQAPGAPQPRGIASTTKRVAGFTLGINQNLSRTSLLQLKYANSEASGYLTDPYKILSVIESPSGRTLDYIFEYRPGSRRMQSVYLTNKTYLAGDVLHLSYRYYWDEWDIRSNTVDVRYQIQLDERKFIQPKFRYYTQSAADFFYHSLPNNTAMPTFASADFRMAAFDAYTVGFRYGISGSENQEHSISVDYYTQIGESHPDDAIGLQKEQDLFPTLQTLVIFYNYAFTW